ncbi:MAG: hypothetical protein JNL30_14505 [Rubrivivax sp.]|nr:hypothetical protein [Rubrivivax sp.]
MRDFRFASEPPPAWGTPLGAALADLLTRGVAMGLLGDPAAALAAPDGERLARLLQALQRHGIGGDAARALAPLLPAAGGTRRGQRAGQAAAVDPAAAPQAIDAPTQHALALEVKRLAEALEDSAAPAAEWPAMRAVFGDEMLGALVEVSPASLRRYAGGERATPQEVADRLHWLALVVADLAGAYNDFGMRRWFERPRTQLSGKSPRQLLGRRWHVDGEPAQRVRALAAVLRGAHPLAA